MGVILFELVNGFVPFGGRTKLELIQNIQKGNFSISPDVVLSPICVDIILKLLKANPDDRMKWTDFFEHPFIRCDPKTYRPIYD